MNENWTIALVMFGLGQLVLLIGACAGTFFLLNNKIYDSKIESEHRFTQLETKLEKWSILTGAAALHSPDDHLKADKELERFVMLYRHHNHDMPLEDWKHYGDFFNKMSRNPDATPNERILAEGLKELCEHKIQRDGMFIKC